MSGIYELEKSMRAMSSAKKLSKTRFVQWQYQNMCHFKENYFLTEKNAEFSVPSTFQSRNIAPERENTEIHLAL